MKRMTFNQKVKRKRDQVSDKSQLLKSHQTMSKIRKNCLKWLKKAQVSIFNDLMSLILLSLTSLEQTETTLWKISLI